MESVAQRKRSKREIQDENKHFETNFDYLRFVGEQRKRQTSMKKQVSSRSQPSMTRLQPVRAVHNVPMCGRRGVSQGNLSPSPAPAHTAALAASKPLRNLRRLSLPLRPLNGGPQPAPPVSPPRLRSQVLREEGEDALPHTPPTSCIPILRPNSINKMRRTLSGSVQKPWRTLRGSLRAKVADQVRASVMRGKQDYSLPSEIGQLEYLRFLTAQQARTGQVTHRHVSIRFGYKKN